MKIKIQTTTDTIIAANTLMQRLYELPFYPSKIQNVYKSIGFDVADKLDKKVKNAVKKGNLYHNAELSFSLAFHEAWALEKIVLDLVPDVKNNYQRILLERLAGELNQKMT